MIARDLILTDSGVVILIQDQPFERAIVRAEFYCETGYLIIIYDNEDSVLIECELRENHILQALTASPTLLLTHLENGKPADGFEVPLISIRV
jgi:hypothetical protein